MKSVIDISGYFGFSITTTTIVVALSYNLVIAARAGSKDAMKVGVLVVISGILLESLLDYLLFHFGDRETLRSGAYLINRIVMLIVIIAMIVRINPQTNYNNMTSEVSRVLREHNQRVREKGRIRSLKEGVIITKKEIMAVVGGAVIYTLVALYLNWPVEKGLL